MRMVADSVMPDPEAAGSGFHVARDAHAEEASVGTGRSLVAPERFVVEHGGGLLQRLGRGDPVERRAGHGGVRKIRLLHDVAPPELEGIDAGVARRDVEHELASDGLEHPRAAVRAATRGVGDHTRARPTHLPDLVGAGKKPQDARAAASGRVRTQVVDVLHLHRGDDAVVVERDRHLCLLGTRVRRGDEVLVTVLRPLHRTAEQTRRERERGLLAPDVDLLPERAPDVGHDDVHLRDGKAEESGEVIPRGVRALARDPDRHVTPGGIPTRHRAAGLHRHRDVPVLADRLGHDMSGGFERDAELRVVG